MTDILEGVRSPLFDGISEQERGAMLGCIGYHIGTFKKGGIVALEGENLHPSAFSLMRDGFG